jgi:hypothetical protein
MENDYLKMNGEHKFILAIVSVLATIVLSLVVILNLRNMYTEKVVSDIATTGKYSAEEVRCLGLNNSYSTDVVCAGLFYAKAHKLDERK